MNDPMNDPPQQAQSATISATVIRADGTVEVLGVIASSEDGTVTIETEK